MYELKIPNLKVKTSLNDRIFSMITDYLQKGVSIQNNTYIALMKTDMASFRDVWCTLFASLTYQNYVNNNISIYEGFYASVVYASFVSLGLLLIEEATTNRGRIDLALNMEQKIYIIEFKIGSGDALQ